MHFVTLSVALIFALETQQTASERLAEIPAGFDGVIEPYRVVQLSSPVDGLLETVKVDRGDIVGKGQTIATLESSVEKATLAIATARTELVGALEKRKARLEYTARKVTQDQELHTNGILPQDVFDQTKTGQELAEAELREVQENLRMARLEMERAEAALELRTIRSPIHGVVVKRFLSPGELVTSQNHSKIVQIAQIDVLRVEVILPVAMFGKVRVGMEAKVRPQLLSGDPLAAQVKTVDRVIDAASGTFRVSLELPNQDNSLAAGLKCKVRFSGSAE